MLYLGQTNLEIDTNVIYDLDGQEVYKTKPVKGGKTQICTVKGYELEGINVRIYELDFRRKKRIKLK